MGKTPNPVKNPAGTAKSVAMTVLKRGGLGLAGLLISRTIISRIAGDNTLPSAAIKGLAAVMGGSIDKSVAVGVAIDAADDVVNSLGLMQNIGGGGGGPGRMV